jgi:hypothetical protein
MAVKKILRCQIKSFLNAAMAALVEYFTFRLVFVLLVPFHFKTGF